MADSFKRIIDYNTAMDLINDLRNKMKLQQSGNDYDEMLNSWKRLHEYISTAPIEQRGGALPQIRTSRR